MVGQGVLRECLLDPDVVHREIITAAQYGAPKPVRESADIPKL